MSYSQSPLRDQYRIRHLIDDPWRRGACDDLNYGLTWMFTSQGENHWRSIYNYLFNAFGTDGLAIADPAPERAPTDEDFDYLRSLLPRITPRDAFLEDRENKEYVKQR